jgi:ferredoxin-type protein NapF
LEKLKRREAFANLFRKVSNKDMGEDFIFPPYLTSKELLYVECVKCDGDCVTACPENIIKITDKKIPVLDFKDSGCTFCQECAIVCPNGVLSLEDSEPKIYGKTNIHVLECISWKQTICYSCKDICLENAIDFLGMFRPEINSKCTNCGFCISVCPTDAITLKV